jgi:hypothetical protein
MLFLSTLPIVTLLSTTAAGKRPRKIFRSHVDNAYIASYVDGANMEGAGCRAQTAREDKMTAFGVLFLVAMVAATFYFTPAH